MATITKRTRKRKLEEADISLSNTDSSPKRAKLTQSSAKPNTSNISDPFASFANKSNGFSSIKQQSTSLSLSESPKEPSDTNDSFNWPHKNNTDDFGIFDSFSSNTNAHTFSNWNAQNKTETKNSKSKTKSTDNSNGFQWGNSNANEFKFSANASQFSISDLSKSEPITNNDSNGEHKSDSAIATLKGQIESGDRNDKTVFSIKCTVYELDPSVTKYKEKGIGSVKLNTYKGGNRQNSVRLLCRKDVTFKTLINAVLMKETKFDKAGEKSVRFTVFEQKQRSETDKKKEDSQEIVTVAKSYLLKSMESDKNKIDMFVDKIKEMQKKM